MTSCLEKYRLVALFQSYVIFIYIVAILNKSENASPQLFIFCEQVLDTKYLLNLNNVSQTSSKRFVETPPICLV